MSRFFLACGGTGGHLAPGIALAEELVARGHEPVLLISQKRIDARLSAAYPQLRFVRIPGAPLGWNPVALLRFVVQQSRGLIFGVRAVRRERPAAILGFGGFTTASYLVAGLLHRVPVALHEANRVPGRAVRLLGRFARRVYLPPGVALPGVSPRAILPVNLPVRREIQRRPRDAARAALGLDPAQRLLVVLGGSQGATPLNAWVEKHLATLASLGVQVYTVTGPGKGETETRALRTATGAPVQAVFVPFSDQIADLLSAADLVVTRAGAGTIAELIRCETPAILVPYPHAADDHQRANAAHFERQGGGLVVPQTQLDSLLAEVRELLTNGGLLQRFRHNLRLMQGSSAATQLVNDLETLVGPSPAPARRAAAAPPTEVPA